MARWDFHLTFCPQINHLSVEQLLLTLIIQDSFIIKKQRVGWAEFNRQSVGSFKSYDRKYLNEHWNMNISNIYSFIIYHQFISNICVVFTSSPEQLPACHIAPTAQPTPQQFHYHFTSPDSVTGSFEQPKQPVRLANWISGWNASLVNSMFVRLFRTYSHSVNIRHVLNQLNLMSVLSMKPGSHEPNKPGLNTAVTYFPHSAGQTKGKAPQVDPERLPTAAGPWTSPWSWLTG